MEKLPEARLIGGSFFLRCMYGACHFWKRVDKPILVSALAIGFLLVCGSLRACLPSQPARAAYVEPHTSQWIDPCTVEQCTPVSVTCRITPTLCGEPVSVCEVHRDRWCNSAAVQPLPPEAFDHVIIQQEYIFYRSRRPFGR